MSSPAAFCQEADLTGHTAFRCLGWMGWMYEELMTSVYLKTLATALISTLFSSRQLFEGLKAFRGDDNQLRLFRPMLNMSRMSNTAKRACLPVRWM